MTIWKHLRPGKAHQSSEVLRTITENSHKNSMLLILARPLLLWLRQHERSTREVEMSVSKNQKVHGVIHTASAASAGVGAGLAQIPGADAPVIAGIQTTMIIGIAEIHGTGLNKAAAANLLLTFTATIGGRTLSQFLVGWIPGWGNAINASTAAALTEAVGWAADAYFAEQRDAKLIECPAV